MWLLNSGSSFSRQLPWLFTKGMLLMGNSFSRHSWHTASGKPHLTSLNRAAFVRKQNPFVYFVVIKLAVHRSLASCPGSSPKECPLWKIPSPYTLGTLPQENHNLTSLNRTAFIRKQNPFVYFAVVKLAVHRSLASCPDPSPKECSLWETPAPDTLGTLPQGNHNLTSLNRTAFIRKQNPFVFFVVTKLWFTDLSPVARTLHQRNAPHGKLLLQTLLARCLRETTTSLP